MTGTAAITYVNQATANGDLDFTYREEGLDGNYVGVELLDPAAASQTLAVTYNSTTKTISVSLATDSGSVLTTTSDQLKTAFNGVKAAGVLTSANTGTWTTGCTVVIGGQTYTGRTTLGTAPVIPYEFLLETDGDTCIDNLVLAINGGAGSGTKYSAGTLKHSLVSAARSSPTVAISLHTLGTFTDHSGHNGSGILAALARVDPASSGGTPGVGTTYDSATTAMAAGWIFPDSSVGAVVVQNDQPKGTIGGNTITSYEAYVHDSSGGRQSVYADSAAHLLTGLKSFAISKAAKGQPRDWAPRAWYSPTLYTR